MVKKITHINPAIMHHREDERTYFIKRILSLDPLDSPTKVSVVNANPSIKNAEIYTKFNRMPLVANWMSLKLELLLI